MADGNIILDTRERLVDDLRERVLVIDGAMGTMIQKTRLSEGDFRGRRFKNSKGRLSGCNDLLCVTRPDIITGIHRAYLEAGADIIETNTFNSNGISLAEYGISDRVGELNIAGASLAREAADDFMRQTGRRIYVAGSMGPSGASLSLGGDIGFDNMAGQFRLQAKALAEGGADILLLETVFDTLNAKAAIYGIEKAFEDLGRRLPLMISATLTESGRLFSGETIETFLASISHAHPVSVGFNCSFGADAMDANVEALSRTTPYYISVYPNAGLPDATGRYPETPEKMAYRISSMLEKGFVNIAGGCCGTTPEHIRAIAAAAKNARPFRPHE